MTALDHGNVAFSKNKHNSATTKAATKTPTSWVVLRHELEARRPQEKHSRRFVEPFNRRSVGYARWIAMAVIHSKKKIRRAV